ncbi:pathogenesis-related homeodomain protein [Abrus precatorius]|uniref:Pathogenesis-related homeodomain protein n=1 Tax=Abrus precatorius TaxID=3816 RepID=A0A8B8JYR7_ABRPR|nr:pathogenesis-related homeodomain protein [Abrus precatorius]XP_027336666.1 pathogenesis-related homeodomain protein [Abrus precatorius]XP_027336675.1 pathogenesis-related homeodomain protein [Abrus precatorius]
MKDTENLNNKRSRKSSQSKEQTKSKLVSSKFKTRSTKCRGKKHKVKSKSHKLRVGTNTSRRTVSDSSIKAPIEDSSNKNVIIRKNLHKTDGKSSQMLSSAKLQGEKVSHSSRKHGIDVDEKAKIKKRKRRRKKKRRRDKVDLDDASRLLRRTRYLLIKMKLEQNLIDAYSGEGWKGQSREKIRPEKELLRAKKQILKCKLSIRDAIHQLDSLSSVGSIEDSVIAPDGSVYHEHIFCANCKLHEAFPDNDIILCDGTCNRAFHQRCLNPPLDTENIPPGDQGWFCKFCECKIEILEATNAHLGTQFSLDSTWQDVFKEEASMPDGDIALLNPVEEWPSDDPEDDDYNPERKEDSHSINMEGDDENASDDLSSSSSPWSLNGESSPVDDSVNHEYYSVNSCLYSDKLGEIAFGRRQRRAVDYKKLYDEMFGKDALPSEQVSEDEDWGPGKRKQREKESDAVNTLITLHESENKYPNNENNDKIIDGSSGIQVRRPCFRIPLDAVEKLRQVFAENELPPRSVKEGLSKELGLDPEKVSKWFKNARYLALKTRRFQAEGEQLQSFTSKISKDSVSQNMEKDELLKSKASKITVTHSQKNGENVTCKEKIKLSSPLKKRQPKLYPPVTRQNGNKDTVEISDDISLKKLLKKRKKRVNFTFEGDSQAAELEFERLSKVKIKLDSMKQKLNELQNFRAKDSHKLYLNEPCVIYVPTAELREKVE